MEERESSKFKVSGSSPLRGAGLTTERKGDKNESKQSNSSIRKTTEFSQQEDRGVLR